jgi:two-component system phosphate regulon sensor histidine kinase PhoR
MTTTDLLILALAGLCACLLAYTWRRLRALSRAEGEISRLHRDLQSSRTLADTVTARLNTLIELAFDAVLLVDPERRVIAANSAACHIFDVRGEAVGRSVMHITRHHVLDDMVNDLLRGQESPEAQLEIGNRIYRVQGGQARGPTPAVILILQDVTELLRLSRARRDMVANLSHDLRTPISSMRLLVESLIFNLGKNPERDMRNLGKIASMVDSLQHMTQELMDLSMIESGQAMMRMVNVDLSELLGDSLRLMESQIDQKQIELSNKVVSGLTVLADPDQIKRVIMNLIHNAVKFTPEKGQIHFEANIDQRLGSVTLCVKDTGPGIPPQERTRVFERFYQVDSARTFDPGERKKAGLGTGLGLAIAKHIVEAHGGKIWAEAGIPSGARICFTLPLDPVPNPDARPQAAEVMA